MLGHENDRETGARKFPARTGPDASDEFSREAAENKKPAGGVGLTEALDEVNEKTRHSDGRQPATSPAPGEDTVKP